MSASIISKVAGITSGFGGNTVVADNIDEVNGILDTMGDRQVAYYTYTGAVTSIAGSSTVTISAGTIKTNELVNIGSTFTVGSGTRHYRVKTIPDDITIGLHEEILVADQIIGTSTLTFYRLDWMSIFLMDNEYVGNISLSPGIEIVGASQQGVRFVENGGGSADNPWSPITDFSENSVRNITLAPNREWTSVDGGIVSTNGEHVSVIDAVKHWGGQVGVIDNVLFNAFDAGGSHAGGNAIFPLLADGRVYVKNSVVFNDVYNQISPLQDSDSTSADETNTFLIFDNTRFELINGWATDSSPLTTSAGCLYLAAAATYKFHNCNIGTREDYAYNPSGSLSVAGINVNSASKVIVDITGGTEIQMHNTSGVDPTIGVDVQSEADVNITHANIEASGTGAIGIRTDDTNAIVNLRQSRVKGGTNSLVNTTGTINAKQANGTDNGTVSVVGATSGTITATET